MEIIFSAGLKPIDLNNLFITSDNPKTLVSQAEAAGFSHNTCAWIKGIYSTVINHDIKKVIAVTGGDCSNTIVNELLIQLQAGKDIWFLAIKILIRFKFLSTRGDD